MSSVQAARTKRPRYLLVAVLTMWLVGLSEAAEGFTTLQVLSDPWFGGSDSSQLLDLVLATTRQHYAALLPLNIARVLAGCLMVGVCVVALFSWRLSVGVALQALAFVVGITLAGYFVERPVRSARLDAVLAQQPELLEQQAHMTAEDVEAARWLMERLALGTELTALTLCAVALTRPRARRFLSAQATRREEP